MGRLPPPVARAGPGARAPLMRRFLSLLALLRVHKKLFALPWPFFVPILALWGERSSGSREGSSNTKEQTNQIVDKRKTKYENFTPNANPPQIRPGCRHSPANR